MTKARIGDGLVLCGCGSTCGGDGCIPRFSSSRKSLYFFSTAIFNFAFNTPSLIWVSRNNLVSSSISFDNDSTLSLCMDTKSLDERKRKQLFFYFNVGQNGFHAAVLFKLCKAATFVDLTKADVIFNSIEDW